MPDTNKAVDPSAIMSLSTAFWDAQALLTANRIGVFEALTGDGLTIDALCERIAIKPRPARLLLNACVALDLLAADGEVYRNSPQSDAFLVPGKPGYLGNAIRYSDNLFDTWGQLEVALREDRPPMQTKTYTGEDQQITRDFVYGMHDRAVGIGRVLVEMIDLTGRTKMLDVGGGPGTYSALFAERTPGLKSRVMDLPGVVAHARDIVATFGVADRVDTVAGDFTKDDFPVGNDVVMISGVFHRESEAGCRRLIEKAHGSLVSGGLFVVSDVFADAGGTSPVFATMFGLNMMLTAPDGGVHADVDVADWMVDQGFVAARAQAFPAPMPHRVVTAEKP